MVGNPTVPWKINNGIFYTLSFSFFLLLAYKTGKRKWEEV